MRGLLRLMFGVNLVLLVTLLVSFPFLEPGTGSYVVAVLAGGFVILTLLLTGVPLYLGWEGFQKDPLRRDEEDDPDAETERS